MCILSLSLGVGPRWSVVLLANRDELHARPSAPLAHWDDDEDIISGRDLVSGGTWLGVSSHGLAAVTNLRGAEPADPSAPSRGRLVRDFLEGGAPGDGVGALSRLNPFNLLTVRAGHAQFLTNRPVQTIGLGQGVHGLSNGPVGEAPAKVIELNGALERWLASGRAGLDLLFDALQSERSAAGASPGDGVFVRRPVYGTRCSTVVVVDHDGKGVIEEHRFDEEGLPTGGARRHFRWPAQAFGAG
jgi:uncharacterized protein with NRDE domain